MSWVNLNDVYVNKTGGAIAGDLSVGGALTVNDGKGTNSTYNVANEITTLRDCVSQEKIGDYQVNLAGSIFNINAVYIPHQNAIRVICNRISGYMIASGNGYQRVTISLPSKYTPSTNTYFIGLADFSAQFSVYVELKTDGKLYLTASYYNGMHEYGANKISGMLYL